MKLVSLAEAAALLGLTGRGAVTRALRRLRAIEERGGVRMLVTTGHGRATRYVVDVGALRKCMPSLFHRAEGVDPEIIAEITERFAVFEARDRELHERGNILADAIVKLTEEVRELRAIGARRFT